MRASFGSLLAVLLSAEQTFVARADLALPPNGRNVYAWLEVLSEFWQNGKQDLIETGKPWNGVWLDYYALLDNSTWVQRYNWWLRNVTFWTNFATVDELGSAHAVEYYPIWSGNSDYVSWAACDQIFPQLASWFYFDMKPNMDQSSINKTYANDVCYDFMKMAVQFGCNFNYVKFVNAGVDSLCNFAPYSWLEYQSYPPTGPDDCSNPPNGPTPDNCDPIKPPGYGTTEPCIGWHCIKTEPGLTDCWDAGTCGNGHQDPEAAFEIEVQQVRKDYDDYQKMLQEKLVPLEHIPYKKMVREEKAYPEGYLPEGVTIVQPLPYNGEEIPKSEWPALMAHPELEFESAEAEDDIEPRDGCAPPSEWTPNAKGWYDFEMMLGEQKMLALETVICSMVFSWDQKPWIGGVDYCPFFCFDAWKTCRIGYGLTFNGTSNEGKMKLPDWTYIVQCLQQFTHGCGNMVVGQGGVTKDNVMSACEHFESCNGDPDWIYWQVDRVANGLLPEKWVEQEAIDAWIKKRNAMSPSERAEVEAQQALGVMNFTRLNMRQRIMEAREKGMPVRFKDPLMLKGILPEHPNKPTPAQLHVFNEISRQYDEI